MKRPGGGQGTGGSHRDEGEEGGGSRRRGGVGSFIQEGLCALTLVSPPHGHPCLLSPTTNDLWKGWKQGRRLLTPWLLLT